MDLQAFLRTMVKRNEHQVPELWRDVRIKWEFCARVQEKKSACGQEGNWCEGGW